MPLRSFLEGQILGEQRAGQGAALLCLHGWGRNRSDLTKVAAGRNALLLDLPGFGSSPPPPDAWGASQYAELVARAVAIDGRGPYVVVGHSFGGRVAVCLGASHPDLVAGMVLIGAPLLRMGPPQPPSLGFRLARAANRTGLISDGRMERLRRSRGSADYAAAEGVMRAVLVRLVAEEYAEELEALMCPVGLCWGEDDREAPLPIAERAATLLDKLICFEVVSSAGHDVHNTHPEVVRAVIDHVNQATRCP